MKSNSCAVTLSWCFALAYTVGCSTALVHKCIHQSLATLATDPSRTIFAAAPEPEVDRIAKRQSATHPFAIHAHFDQTISQLPLANQQLIRDEIVPEVIDFFRKALSVRGSVGRVLLNRQCPNGGFFRPNAVPNFQCFGECAPLRCGPTTVPDEHLAACVSCNRFGTGCQTIAPSGPGVTADFILYVAASGQEPCAQSTVGSQTIAFASHCQQEATLDRPVAGFINICPTALQASLIRDLRATVKHEVLHAIAFSSSLYAFWRDESGNPRTPRNSNNLPPVTFDEIFGFQRFAWGEDTIRRLTVTRDTFSGPVSQSVDILVTPAVVREARSFFGCPELQGVELENQGGSGSALSHWEQRILETETMTAQFTQVAAFSRFTLALLEDSGWYVPDFSAAHPFRFGQGLGCDFVQHGCLTWMRQRAQEGLSIQPFCRRLTSPFTSITGCTFDHLSRGVCTLQSLPTVVPENFRYFARSNEGSFAQFTDFCPFVLEQTGRDPNGVLTAIQCSRTSFQPGLFSNTFAETFGTQSHCIEHGMAQPWTVNGRAPLFASGGSGCYEVFCTRQGVVLSVFGVNFTCTCPGEEIVIDVTASGLRFRGALLCPKCTDICWQNTDLCPDNEPDTCTTVTFSGPGVGVPPTAGTASLLQWSPLAVTLGMTIAYFFLQI